MLEECVEIVHQRLHLVGVPPFDAPILPLMNGGGALPRLNGDRPCRTIDRPPRGETVAKTTSAELCANPTRCRW
jgi:hypothetical protein